MIIDTNGFEIGEEVWWWEIDYLDGNKCTYKSGIIYSIECYQRGIFITIDDKYNSKIHINMCCHNEQEIEDIVNFMNNKECSHVNR